MAHTERVIQVDLETLATIVVLVTTIGSSHALLRREIHDVSREVKADIHRVKQDVDRLDDRVYQLATGLKPLIDQAQRADKDS